MQPSEFSRHYSNGLAGKGYVDTVDVSPDILDFGQVQEVWGETTAIATITNTGSLACTIDDISLDTTGDTCFVITSAPSTSYELAPGMTVDVEVAFAPYTAGTFQNMLHITAEAGLVGPFEIPLTGVGVVSELPPAEMVESTLDFVDDAVAASELSGDGPGQSADGRLQALCNMIEAAGDLIAAGDDDAAYGQLRGALRRVDGEPRPPDFVTGTAASELALMIQYMLDSLR